MHDTKKQSHVNQASIHQCRLLHLVLLSLHPDEASNAGGGFEGLALSKGSAGLHGDAAAADDHALGGGMAGVRFRHFALEGIGNML